MTQRHKQVGLYIQTHDLLEEIIKSNPVDEDGYVHAGKLSKVALIHKLVVEYHKQVIGSASNDNSTNDNNDNSDDKRSED